MLKFVLLPEHPGKISHLMGEKDTLNLIKFKENFIASAMNKVGLEGDMCGLGEAWEHLQRRGYFCSQMCTFFWKLGISPVKSVFPVSYGNCGLDLQFSRSLLNASCCSTHAPFSPKLS